MAKITRLLGLSYTAYRLATSVPLKNHQKIDVSGAYFNPAALVKSEPFDLFGAAQEILSPNFTAAKTFKKDQVLKLAEISAPYKEFLSVRDFKSLKKVVQESYEFFPTYIQWVTHLFKKYEGKRLVFIGGTCEIPYITAQALSSNMGFPASQILYADLPDNIRHSQPIKNVKTYLSKVGIRKGGNYVVVDEHVVTGITITWLKTIMNELSENEVEAYFLDNQKITSIRDSWEDLTPAGTLIRIKKFSAFSDKYALSTPEADHFRRAAWWLHTDSERDKRIIYIDDKGNPHYHFFADLADVYRKGTESQKLESYLRILEIYYKYELLDEKYSVKESINYANTLYAMSITFRAQMDLLAQMLR